MNEQNDFIEVNEPIENIQRRFAAWQYSRNTPIAASQPTGWICPNCNHGIAPTITVCPCADTARSTFPCQPGTVNDSPAHSAANGDTSPHWHDSAKTDT